MKTESLAYKAYSEIRKKILINHLSPNTRLKEDIWAKKLDVSRMAIREALTRLLGEDLVILGAKGGYFVKPLVQLDVREIRELREILEIGALRLAFKKMTPEKIEKLEKICDDFTTMVAQGYFTGVCEVDLKFHVTIIESAENGKLLKAYQTSHIPLFHQKLGKATTQFNDYELTDSEHRQILKAIKEKKLPAAEKLLINHFLRGEATVLDIE